VLITVSIYVVMLKPQNYIKFFILLIVILLSSWLIYIKIKLSAYNLEVKRQSIEIKNLYGVDIHYRYTPESFFPHDRLGRGSQAWLKHIRTTLPLVENFLSKYPREVIRKNLSALFLLGTLEFNGKSYGGTYIDSAIYISTGAWFRYSDSSLLGSMHAEFSSILFHKYEFPKQEWETVNKPSWRYLGSGFDMLGRREIYDQTDELRQNGFLQGYSQASLEEDFNVFVEWTFTKPDRLRKLGSQYERIRKKYQLVIEFYKSIDPKIDIPRITPDTERGEKASP